MLDGHARYAIYWAPPKGSDLARFGAEWLGWDAEAGTHPPRSDPPGLPIPAAEITAAPRRYGFHATVKPPFRLAGGTDPAGLRAAFHDFAAGQAPFLAPPLALSGKHGFLALRFSAPAPGMAVLAAQAVEALDRFRAPPSAEELDRRRARPLPPEAEANLTRWGYPWVMGLFDFHLTLSGALPPDHLAAVSAALDAPTAPFRAAPLAVEELCLFGDPGGGAPFRLLDRARLGG